MNKINSISIKNNNKVTKSDEFDLPKTSTFVLEINGHKSEKYTFVGQYMLYHDNVYRINNSNSIIHSIENEIKK